MLAFQTLLNLLLLSSFSAPRVSAQTPRSYYNTTATGTYTGLCPICTYFAQANIYFGVDNSTVTYENVTVIPHITQYDNGTDVTNYITEEVSTTEVVTTFPIGGNFTITGSTYTYLGSTLTIGSFYDLWDNAAAVTFYTPQTNGCSEIKVTTRITTIYEVDSNAPDADTSSYITAIGPYLTEAASASGFNLTDNLGTCTTPAFLAPGVLLPAISLTEVTGAAITTKAAGALPASVPAEPESSPAPPGPSPTPAAPASSLLTPLVVPTLHLSTSPPASSVAAPAENSPPASPPAPPPASSAAAVAGSNPVSSPSPVAASNPPASNAAPPPPPPPPQTTTAGSQVFTFSLVAPPISRGGTGIPASGAPVVVVDNTATLSRGGVATIGSVVVSLPSTGSVLQVGSTLIPISIPLSTSPPAEVVTAGSAVLTLSAGAVGPSGASEIVVDGTVTLPRGGVATIGGVVVSLPSIGSVLQVGTTIVPISVPSPPSAAEVITAGSAVLTLSAGSLGPSGASEIIVDGTATLTPGGEVTIGTEVVSLPASGTVLDIGSTTVALGSPILCGMGYSSACSTETSPAVPVDMNAAGRINIRWTCVLGIAAIITVIGWL